MMERSAEFSRTLEEAIEKRARGLEAGQVPRLKEALQSYKSFLDSAVSILVRKGMLRNDPYNYEEEVTKIIVPTDVPLPEIDNVEEISYRLAAYRRQLEYLLASHEFSLAALRLAQLKKISALLSYLDWFDMGEGSKSPTTRGFAKAFMKVRLGPDSLAVHILKDSQTQIETYLRQARSLIGELISYQRECWKAEVRAKVLFPPIAGLAAGPAAAARNRREEILGEIKKRFGSVMTGNPWYPALIDEILAEELGEDAEERKKKLLAALAIPEAPPREEKEAQQRDVRPLLLEALRILGRPHEELAAAAETLADNALTLETQELGLGGRIRRWFRPRGKRGDVGRVYAVQYQGREDASLKTETIDFPRFIAEARKKAGLLASLSGGTSAAYRRLEAESGEKLMAYLDSQLNDLLLIHRRMGGLNALFQARAAKVRATTVKGVKLQLLTVRNAIARAHQRRNEGAGLREERGRPKRPEGGGGHG